MQDGIFVSYSHKDNKVVEQIVDILRETSGMEVWFDHKLRGGDNYFSVIANQIIKNKHFVFVVSNNSIESDWCLRELEFAASEKRHIIAIWLDNIDIAPRIKLVIQNTHYINWYSVTEKIFSQSVAVAFKDVPNAITKLNEMREFDDISSKQQKYHLSRDEFKQISNLLRVEENEQYSVCFEPINANLLGIAYELGISVDIDINKALLYYKASKYSGNLDGMYLYSSLMLQNNPECNEYLQDMLSAAEGGSVLALTCVGDFYYEGQYGFPLDKEKAYEYYEAAAKLNGAAAMYYTAFGYRNGESLPKDIELAYMYALKAKEKGFPRAYRLLAIMYECGDFVHKDLQKAIELYDNAIKLGDYLSYCYQGFIYGELGNADKKVELYKKAVELAENGDIKSGMPFYRLAFLYEEGVGVTQDFELSIKYYLKAAERKHKLSRDQVVFKILLLDNDKQLPYLQQAYAFGCKRAAYSLGQMEKAKRKNDKEKLSDLAVKYFEEGAVSGDIACVLELLWNYSWIIGNGCSDGSDREDRINDRTNAIKWFQFLFANADEAFIESLRESKLIATYYYAYAIELDYDPECNKPDREFVLYNFKKSVEESPLHIGRIIGFSVDGYLFPDEFDSGLTVDVLHAEEVLNFAVEHIGEYLDYLKENTPCFLTEINKTNAKLRKGFSFISDCYRTGKYVSKNKEKADKYKKLAERF